MSTEYLKDAAASQATTTTIEDLHPDVATRILRLLDGPALAALCSASSHLRSLSTQSDLWLRLCLSKWPSLQHPRLLPLLSASPQSFFSDAFTFPASHVNTVPVDADDLPGELISAVDIYHRGVLIFSRVVETDTSSPWFRSSPFHIEAMEQKAEPPLPGVIIAPADLTLSWILIDPVRGRAVNASSRRAVAVERHWYTRATIVRFAAAEASERRVISPAVTCNALTGKVQEVVLSAEDIDGACVSGEEGLQVVTAAMEARRKGKGSDEEVEKFKKCYFEFLSKKERRKECRARREGAIELCCAAVGAAIFIAFLARLFFR